MQSLKSSEYKIVIVSSPNFGKQSVILNLGWMNNMVLIPFLKSKIIKRDYHHFMTLNFLLTFHVFHCNFITN